MSNENSERLWEEDRIESGLVRPVVVLSLLGVGFPTRFSGTAHSFLLILYLP